MKRKICIGAVIAALIYIWFAFHTSVMDPADFVGTWYRASDGARCQFENGIVQCPGQETMVLDDAVFSGAYSFAKDKIAIFVVDDHGVGEVTALNLIRRADGDMLCERSGGKNIVWFCRNPEAVKMEH